MGSFFCHCNLHWFLQPEAMRLYFLVLEPRAAQCTLAWGWNRSLPNCPSWFLFATCEYGTTCLQDVAAASSPSHTASSLPLLPAWMNVSSTPWLSDFYTVQFSGPSWFLDWLLSLLWHARKISKSTYPSILAKSY